MDPPPSGAPLPPVGVSLSASPAEGSVVDVVMLLPGTSILVCVCVCALVWPLWGDADDSRSSIGCTHGSLPPRHCQF